MKKLALRMQFNASFGFKRISFFDDDRFLLITDGVMESKNPDRVEFGLSRLRDSFQILGRGKNYFNSLINKQITKSIKVEFDSTTA